MTDLQLLDSGWSVRHDPENTGRADGWMNGLPQEGTVAARVPGLVHLYLPDAFGVAWYQITFTDILRENGRRLLCFERAIYLCEVYVNGALAGTHRGCEDPFYFDITDLLIKGENLLSVRVSKPYSKDVDGYTIGEIPHRNERKDDLLTPGTCFNTFGLAGAVELVRVPEVYIEDLYVYGDIAAGVARVQATVMNTGRDTRGTLLAAVSETRTGRTQTVDSRGLEFPAGTSVHEFALPVAQLRRWDVKDPFLYCASIELLAPTAHKITKKFGFRDFVVDPDGWFRLNGRRIFVRCAHTGNFFPGGNNQALDSDLWRQELAKAKACGFNMVRFISGAAFPEQLDYCDELGLMVYEEPAASWLTENGPRDEEIFLEDLLTMVRRDRSHACLTVLGTLNETKDTDPYGNFVHIARKSLDEIRKLDRTRLVLYSSGRFEGDGFVGSVSNPFSDRWECLWNGENEESGEHVDYVQNIQVLLNRRVGDLHAYPTLPLRDIDLESIRAVGHTYKRPVFFSEFGAGSLLNTSHALARYKMLGVSPDTPDMKMLRKMDDLFRRDLVLYGIDDLYPFPIDLLRASERLHNAHRTLCFDLMRANPYINGYSITGLVDHSICGEGLWNLTREFKPGIADAIEQGFAPLRWCLFVRRTHVYRGREFIIEGVLANEDVLQVGYSYPIGVKIIGEKGTVWAREYTLTVTREMVRGMSVPVFKEKIALDVPEGRYELHAEVLEYATASDPCRTFYLSDPAKTKARFDRVFAAGLSAGAQRLLGEQGVEVLPLEQADENSLILIGEVPGETRAGVWERVEQCVRGGARAFAASRYSLVRDEADTDWCAYLPVEDKPESYPRSRKSLDWLYHKEYIAKRHPYFEGLPQGGIMNWYYYMNIISGAAFRHGALPADVAAACVGPGTCPNQPHGNKDGYEGGFNIGTYPIGKGALTITSFDILPHNNENPAADRLLINILNTENEKLKAL